MELLEPNDLLPELKLKGATIQIKTRVPLSQAQQIDVLASTMNITRSALLRDCLNWFLSQQIPRRLLKALDQKEYRDRMKAYGNLVEIKQSLQTIAETNHSIDDQLLLETQHIVRQAIRAAIGLPFDSSTSTSASISNDEISP